MATFSRFRRVATWCCVAALFICLGGIWGVGTILTAPRLKQIGSLPADLPGENITFSSASGSLIHGWLVNGKKGVVILMHSVRGNRLDMLGRARFLHAAGYSVLLFDFQAHGESPGKNISFGYLESRDASAAVEFVRKKFPGEKIGIYGGSLGGASALLARPALQADAMILENGLSDHRRCGGRQAGDAIWELWPILESVAHVSIETAIGVRSG